MLQLAKVSDEQSPTISSPDPDWFGSFWLLFPRKEAKKDAMRAWRQIPPVDYPAILEALVAWRNVWRQQQRATHHICLPASWLRGERYNDEIPSELQASSVGSSRKAPLAGASVLLQELPSRGEGIPPAVQKVLDQLMGRKL